MSVDDYKFNVEKLANILDESYFLYEEHHNELVGEHVKFNPDVQKYLNVEKNSNLYVFTIRDSNKKLVGYSYFMCSPHHHRTQVIVAENTLFFITHDHRKGWLASKFIKFCEQKLFEFGISQIHMRTKVRASFGVLLKRLKYKEEEIVYIKKKE